MPGKSHSQEGFSELSCCPVHSALLHLTGVCHVFLLQVRDWVLVGSVPGAWTGWGGVCTVSLWNDNHKLPLTEQIVGTLAVCCTWAVSMHVHNHPLRQDERPAQGPCKGQSWDLNLRIWFFNYSLN